MIRFSNQGTKLLFGASREGTCSGQSGYLFVEIELNVQNKTEEEITNLKELSTGIDIIAENHCFYKYAALGIMWEIE